MRRSMASRSSSVHGSAPNMPVLSEQPGPSSPWRSNSSAMVSMYEGVTMISSGLKVDDQLHLPFGLPPEIGTTVQPRRSAP